MSAGAIDVGHLVDEKKIGRFHIQIVVMCFLVMLIDGFNISIASFAGPGLIKQFAVSPTELGTLFSAGLLAGLAGTPLFGALADRFGRKRVVILGALFFGVFTLAALVATTFREMILFRFIAGIGVAGVLPTTAALASEFAPRRFRATMVILMFTGSTIGGVVSGLVAAQFVPAFGWQILFAIAGAGPIVLAVFLIFLLPESVHYLLLHERLRPELVKVLRRIDPSLVIDDNTKLLASRSASLQPQQPMKASALFAGRLAVLTPLFWFANFLSMMVFYFASSWLPTILRSSSIGAEHAALATSLFLVGGTLGGLGIMRPLDRFGFAPVVVLFFAGIPALIVSGQAGLSAPLLLVAVILAGFCIYGIQFGLIATEGPLFPPPVRGRGLGSCFAAARIGATIGPFVGGILITQHLATETLFILFSIPLFIGGLTGLVIAPMYRKQVSETAHDTVARPQSRAVAAAQ